MLVCNDQDTATASESFWGKYKYCDQSDRLSGEKIWYDLLTKSDKNIDDLIHYWQQFWLNWPILTDDLQKLSKTAIDDTTGREGAPLNTFKSKHSILLSVLKLFLDQ